MKNNPGGLSVCDEMIIGRFPALYSEDFPNTPKIGGEEEVQSAETVYVEGM
jgi:hypothetical protein